MFQSNVHRVFAFALTLAAAPLVNAATITFNDAGTGPATITVTGTDAARVTGASCTSDGSGGELCTATIGVPTTYVQGTGVGDNGPANIFDDAAFTQISDTFSRAFTFNSSGLIGIVLTFRSNDTQPLITANFPRSILETGSLQLLDSFSWGNTGITDTINFISDDAVTAQSPEPSTFVALGSGLLALGAIARRKKKQ